MYQNTATQAVTRETVSGAKTHQWWILAVLATAQLMVIRGVTIVNVALPLLQADLAPVGPSTG